MSRPVALECNNCGAPLSHQQRTCEYCGTNYRWNEDRAYMGPVLQMLERPVNENRRAYVSLTHSSQAYGTAYSPW